MSDLAVERQGYPKFCSVEIPDHNAKHFRTFANAEYIFQVIENKAVVLKDRYAEPGKKFPISDEELVVLKLKHTPIG